MTPLYRSVGGGPNTAISVLTILSSTGMVRYPVLWGFGRGAAILGLYVDGIL